MIPQRMKQEAKNVLLSMGFNEGDIHEDYSVLLDTTKQSVNMAGVNNVRKVAVQFESIDILKILQLRKIFDEVWILNPDGMFAVNVSKEAIAFGYDCLVAEFINLAKKHRELEQKWNVFERRGSPKNRKGLLQIRCTKTVEDKFRKYAIENRLTHDETVDQLLTLAKDKEAVEKIRLQARMAAEKTDIAIVPFEGKN